jgi:hypothetical protein
MADEMEVRAAAKRTSEMSSGGGGGADDSQSPRSASVWLLLPDAHHKGSERLNSRYMDGAAAWCMAETAESKEALITHMRCTVFAGVDADAVLCATTEERSSHPEHASPDAPRFASSTSALGGSSAWVGVRWCTSMGRMTTELRELPFVGDASTAQKALQSEVVSMALAFDAPLHFKAFSNVPEETFEHGGGTFGRHVCHVASCFEAIINCRERVLLTPALRPSDGPLEFTDVFIRISPRDAPSQAEEEAHTFHGVILAPSAHVAAAREFCADASQGLRPPRGIREEMLGIHICAVHMEERRLGRSVSLFGGEGLAGKPIQPPQSRVLATVPFLRPLDDNFFENFSARTCSAKSIMPLEEALHEGFSHTFERCAVLHTGLKHPVDPQTPSSTVQRHSARVPSLAWHASVQSRSRGCERSTKNAENAENAFVMTALRMNWSSERSTVGDALGHIFRRDGAPPPVIALLMNAVRRYGVLLPMCDLLKACFEGGAPPSTTNVTRTVFAPGGSDALDRIERLEKLVDLAFRFSLPERASQLVSEAQSEAKPASDSKEAAAWSPTALRRAVSACNLQRRRCSTLVCAGRPSQWLQAVQTLWKAVHGAEEGQNCVVLRACERVLKKAATCVRGREWTERVDAALGAAICMLQLQRESANEALDPMVLLHRPCGKTHVVMQQVRPCGARVCCNPEVLLGACHPKVLTVHCGVGCIRLTAYA